MTDQLKAGAVLNYVVIFLNTMVGLLYTPYMLRMMGQSEYGLYSLVASVIAYLTILDLGFGNAIIRYTSKFRAENKQTEQFELFGMFFSLYCLVGLIAILAGLGLYFNVESIFNDAMTESELSRAKIMLLILVFNLGFTFPMSVFGSIIMAYERFVFPKILIIIRIILNTVVMVLLLHLGYKAIAMVVIQTVFNVSTLIIHYFYCIHKLKIKLYFRKIKFDLLKEIIIYSFWIFLNAIMDRVYWSTGQFVLGAIVGTTAVAVFAVAIQLQQMYMQFSTAISSVFLPKVTGMVVLHSSTKDISDLFIRTGRIQNVIMILILLGFIVFGRSFIILWAGADYKEAYLITLCFFISLYIPLIQNLGITILQARNQMKFRSVLYIIIASFAFLFQILFSKMWGGLGCAIAISSALLLGQGVIMNIYYAKKQGIDIIAFWRNIFKMNLSPILISLFFFIIVSNMILNNWYSLFIMIGLYLLTYSLLLYKFSLNPSERELFLSLLKRVVKYDRYQR